MRKFILALAAIASIGAASFGSTSEASAHGWYGRYHSHYFAPVVVVRPFYAKRHYWYGY